MFEPRFVRFTVSIASSMQAHPHERPPASNAGPEAAEVQSICLAFPITISALVPRSSSMNVLSVLSISRLYSPEIISPPINAPKDGIIYTEALKPVSQNNSLYDITLKRKCSDANG